MSDTIDNQKNEKDIKDISYIKDKVLNLIAKQLDVDIKDIKLHQKFREGLKVDSLDMVELVMSFELEFDITISDEAAEKILTVEDSVKFVEDQIAKK